MANGEFQVGDKTMRFVAFAFAILFKTPDPLPRPRFLRRLLKPVEHLEHDQC